MFITMLEVKMNLEEFVRNSFNEINELTKTDNTDYYTDDYLRLLNFTTSEEEIEIREIIKNIIIGLERIVEIQDDCYGR